MSIQSSNIEKLKFSLDGFRARVMAHWFAGNLEDADVDLVVAKIGDLQKFIDVDLCVLMKKYNYQPEAPKGVQQ